MATESADNGGGWSYRGMSSDNIKGLVLALSSSFFIGASFIVKKKGLKKAGASGVRAGTSLSLGRVIFRISGSKMGAGFCIFWYLLHCVPLYFSCSNSYLIFKIRDSFPLSSTKKKRRGGQARSDPNCC